MKITRLDPQTREPSADAWTLSRSCRLLLIGRDPPADILLDSPNVSPRHAELSWQAGSLTIRDLASINGVTLRGSRILRAVLQDQDVFSLGDIPFLVTVEPSDFAARRTRRLTLAGVALGSALLAIFVLALLRNAGTPEPESPPQDPTPLPPISDAAFQKMSEEFGQAANLVDESRRLLADGIDHLRAAELLQEALILNPQLPPAKLLLQDLRDSYGPRIQKQIDSLVAAGRFQEAQNEIDRQQPLLGSPDVIQQSRAKITQHIHFQDALAALDQDDLDTAQDILDSLSDDLVPERHDALARLAECRTALAWAEKIQDHADRHQLDAVLQLANDEPQYAPYLSDDALGEVHGALIRVRILGDIQHLVAVGNAYSLMRYINEVPQLAEMLRPLRDTLAPQTDTLRQMAAVEAAKTKLIAVPLALEDALASYSTAKALASLYIIEATPDLLRQFNHHSERWNAYLASVATRAQAYADKGARAEARTILGPLLPHLDDYDPASYSLRNLSAHLAPLAFTPETSHLIDRPSPAASSAN